MVVPDVANDGSRPLLRFLENTTDILCNDTEREELHPPEEEHEHIHGREPARRARIQEKIPCIEDDSRKRQEEKTTRNRRNPLKWRIRKRDDCFASPAQIFEETVRRYPGVSLRSHVLSPRLTKAHPCPKSPDKPVALWERIHPLHNNVVHEGEFPSINRRFYIRQMMKKAVKTVVQPLIDFPQALLPPAPNSVHDLVTLLPFPYESFDQFRRILQVA